MNNNYKPFYDDEDEYKKNPKRAPQKPAKKRGPTWEGYYTRVTKTKREAKLSEDRKHKHRFDDDEY